MATLFQAIRGMNDILPTETPKWHRLEVAIRELTASYGYQEIRFPIVEKTDLFKRSIGDVTDIVEKEMYTFEDRNGDSLSLRPEGTASCVRTGIEHGLLHNQLQRLWYMGPMFRHERPQKGRYRQFQQLGIEAFGMSGAEIECELILMTARLWKNLGISSELELEINSLGSLDSRKNYREVLIQYFEKHQDKLDEDSKRRLYTNPLRILDTKNPDMMALLQDAPKLHDYIDAVDQQQFMTFKNLLEHHGISYTLNAKLVRGLDYYNGLVFEWTTKKLGAQGTICAGGRYDSLVQQLGAKLPTPAVGFAMGLERLVALMDSASETAPPDIYIIPENIGKAFMQAEYWREQGLKVVVDCGAGAMKVKQKRAINSGAKSIEII